MVAHDTSEPHHVSRARPRVTSPPLRHSTLQPRILESPYQCGYLSPSPCASSLDDWHLKDLNALGKIFVIVFRRAPAEHGSPTRPASSLRPTLRKCTSPPSCRCLMPTRIQIDVRPGHVVESPELAPRHPTQKPNSDACNSLYRCYAQPCWRMQLACSQYRFIPALRRTNDTPTSRPRCATFPVTDWASRHYIIFD